MSVTLLEGDCLARMAELPAGSVDAIVTDPPYHLTSIVKRFGSETAAPAQFGTDGAFARASRGFMGKEWDGGDVAFRVETWAQALRVLKPGGHLIAFSGTRTYHRMVVAIEDAGFEIRDQLAWVYGSGFPKSHNLDGEWQGWGTALKPAWEPICLARKPLVGTVAANVLAHGTGAINVDGCRVEAPDGLTSGGDKASSPLHMDREANVNRVTERSEGHPLGRFPANLIHDGSDEVTGLFPSQAGAAAPVHRRNADKFRNTFGAFAGNIDEEGSTFRGDSGSAARFFYCAKAGKADRAGSKHPTVKPIALMRYLCRLVTPPGGVVLDPFAGSGTTGAAAIAEGFRPILIEREAEYLADIRRRLGLDALEDLLA